MKRVSFYALLILLQLGIQFTAIAQEASFEIKVQYMDSDDLTWGVFARPANGFEETKDILIGSGQITLLLKNNGVDQIQNIKSTNGRWNSNTLSTKGPLEAPEINYVSIYLTNSGKAFPIKNNKEFLLFTFQSTTCLDTIGLINNHTDPFAQLPNSAGNSPGVDLSIIEPSTGQTYGWKDNYAPFAYSCKDCDEDGIVDALEDTNGDGTFTPNVDVSNLCNNEKDEIATPAANPTQRACITINDVRFKSPSSCGATDGSITVDATHETRNTLQYSIDGGRVWQNTSTIGNLEAGVTYRLELRDNIGLCFESYGEIILDNPNCNIDPCVERPFSINDYPDQTICQGSSTALDASTGVSYTWNPATGLSSTSIATPTANPTVTTTYVVTVTNAEGCTATDEITIIVAESASANAGIDQTICSGSTAQLTASGGISYSWSPTTGLSNPNIENPIATPTTATTYTVMITDRNGCTATDAVTVSIANNLTVSLGTDVMVCEGEEFALSASGGTSYNWSPAEGLDNASSPTPSATVTATTTYCVTVTDNNGCTGSDCITIEVDKNCEGEGVEENSGAGETPNPCIIGPAIIGCPDKFMCLNDQVQLVVNGGIRWEWSPTTGLDDPTSPSPIAAPDQTTTYTVTGFDANGCFATDEVEVIVVTSGNCDLAPPSCQDDDLLTEEEICIDANAATAEVCLPYPLQDANVTFTLSLAAGTPKIVHGCGFTDLYNYQYNFLPEAGQGTNYKVKSWVVNNTIQTGMVNSMQELLSFMQSADPAGNWYLDADLFSIIGGSSSANSEDLMIVHSGKETVLRKNTTQKATGTLVEVDMTGKDREVLIFIDLVSGCRDQITIKRCF